MSDLPTVLNASAGYLFLGLPQDAWNELDTLPPEQGGTDAVIAMRLEILQSQENWTPLRVLAEAMAKRSPENPDWWISWAYALRREKTIEQARGVLWEAALCHPGDALITYNLACYASVLGDFKEARVLLQRALAINPRMKEMASKDSDLKPLFSTEDKPPAA